MDKYISFTEWTMWHSLLIISAVPCAINMANSPLLPRNIRPNITPRHPVDADEEEADELYYWSLNVEIIFSPNFYTKAPKKNSPVTSPHCALWFTLDLNQPPSGSPSQVLTDWTRDGKWTSHGWLIQLKLMQLSFHCLFQ